MAICRHAEGTAEIQLQLESGQPQQRRQHFDYSARLTDTDMKFCVPPPPSHDVPVRHIKNIVLKSGERLPAFKESQGIGLESGLGNIKLGDVGHGAGHYGRADKNMFEEVPEEEHTLSGVFRLFSEFLKQKSAINSAGRA